MQCGAVRGPDVGWHGDVMWGGEGTQCGAARGCNMGQ